MLKSNIPAGVKTLKGWYDKGILDLEHNIQRSAGQWSLLQKSLLIHSMLASFPIPPFYLIKIKNDDGSTNYSAIECKQRLTTVFEFISEDGFEMHASTPPVIYDGFEHDLAGMRFCDLADELKDEILGYRFSLVCLEECTDEEIEEIFTRLNNSCPLSQCQKARSIMGSDLSRWLKEICRYDFFQHSINLTLSQVRKEGDLEALLQTMILLDSRHEGYAWSAISTTEIMKYARHIRNSYNVDKRLMIEEIVDYVSKAFPEKHKFLKKSNIPMVLALAKLALENNITPADFKRFIDAFSNSVCVDYEMNMGSGNIKKIKTEGRLLALATAFADYFDLDNINILSVGEPVGSITDNSDNPEQEYKELAENEELDSDSVSIEEETESTEDFSEAESEEESSTDEAIVSEGEDGYGGECN